MKKGEVKKVYSQILGRDLPVWVCPQPEPRGLLYLMHGNGGRCTDWAAHTEIESLAATYRLAVVAPDFEDSYCTNTADGRPWFDYLSRELPVLVPKLLGRSFDPGQTMIAGLSAGAYGALKLFFANPGSFAACASLSGVTDMAARIALLPARRLPEFRPIFGEKLSISAENDLPVITRGAAERGQNRPVFLACGTGDSFLEMNRRYAALLTELGVQHEYREGPGGHEWSFWSRWLPTALEWMVQQNQKIFEV